MRVIDVETGPDATNITYKLPNGQIRIDVAIVVQPNMERRTLSAAWDAETSAVDR
jgi:hypothetical protein